MRVLNIGHALIALACIGLGILGLIFDDFAMNWQPVPTDLPAREWLAYLSALILLVGGGAVLFERSAAMAASTLGGFFALWLITLQIPKLFSAPLSAASWLGIGETLELVMGLSCLWLLTAATQPRQPRFLTTRLALLGFGLSLPMIGLSHFVYAKETAAIVPAWLPFRIGFAYLTGAGHIAAGLALIARRIPRIALLLEAIMMSSFVLLVHLPGVAADPHNRFQWTMMLVAMAISGCAWSAHALSRKALPISPTKSQALAT